MNYVLPPLITLLVFFGAFAARFGTVSSLKWLGITAIAELVSFIPLLGITGAIAILFASPWSWLIFRKFDLTANTGPEMWGAAIGISFWVPVGFYPAEWLLRSYFPQLSGFPRWSLFFVIVAVWSSFAPLVFCLQDPAFVSLIKGKS